MGKWGIVLSGLVGLLLGLLLGFLVWANSGASGEVRTDPGAHSVRAVRIAPTDFAFLPCPRLGNRGACVVIAAGGKRVLVGAPAGVGGAGGLAEAAFGASGVPDAILLFSLDAAQIEGIDELRSRIWETGRSQLPLVGGTGVQEVSAGLNQTYIIPDAVAYVRGRRQRGFEKMPLAVRMAGHGDLAFDTGDLTISALAAGAGQLAYLVEYGGQSVILAACGPRAVDVSRWPDPDHYLGCADLGADHALRPKANWPLERPVFIAKAE